MAEVNPAGWFQALATHSAEQMRSYLGSGFALPQGAQSLKTAGAVHPSLGTSMIVTQNGTPNMTVNVGSGVCWIGGTESTKQGTYFCQNDAVKNLTIAASDPTLNRFDLIVAKVQDSAYSGGTNAWSLAVVQGTASGSPSSPVAPANSIILARVSVNAGVTAITSGDILDTRPWNAAVGGIVPCTSSARPSNAYESLFAYEMDTNRFIRFDGVNWLQIGIHVCTSSTRPPGPYTGMQIYETDTALNWQWSGTAWVMEPLLTLTAFRTTNAASTVSTTIANDTQLFFANIPANTKWIVESMIIYQADGGADFKMGWTAPAGATFAWNFHGLSSDQTTPVGMVYHAVNGLGGTDFTGGQGAGARAVCWPKGFLVMGGTSGTFSFAWSAATNNGFGVLCGVDSWIRLTRVA